MISEQIEIKAREMKSRKDLLNLIIEIAYDLYPDDYINWSMHELLILCNPNITDSRYNTFYIPKKQEVLEKSVVLMEY